MIIGTAGHIDHGKTTLVRALTGVDTDRLPEEKRRGITIELGFAPLVLDGVGTVGIVDVPGHEAFVRTMVAGASGIDVALLVVAADEGIMPQTREHLAILSLLGTRGGVIALTKCDLVDADWLALVTADVADAVRATPLAGADVVPTSATTGTGLAALRAALGRAVAAVPARRAGEAFRMPVDRAFSVHGTGMVVTGTVWEGEVAPGNPLVVQPPGVGVRVRGVQEHGADVARAGPGQRAAVAIAGTDLAGVTRGTWLCGDVAWPVTDLLRAEVSLLDDARALRPREWVRLHLGTADVGARVVAGGGALQPGERRAARLVLQEPVLARAGDRFVLRLASPPATIGGGVVVDPLPARRRATPWSWTDDAATSLGRVLREAAGAGVDRGVLAVRTGLSRDALDRLLGDPAQALVLGARVFSPEVLEDMKGVVERVVRDSHRDHPLADGTPFAGIAERLGVSGELLDRAISDLAGARRIERRGAVLAAPGWTPRVSGTDSVARDRILAALREAGSEPPDVAELAVTVGADPIPLLRLLERDGLVVGVEPGRFYAVEAVNRLTQKLRDGMTAGREYSPAELRELLGFSRKYLIPFLEFCDRKRITERRPTGRVRGPT